MTEEDKSIRDTFDEILKDESKKYEVEKSKKKQEDKEFTKMNPEFYGIGLKVKCPVNRGLECLYEKCAWFLENVGDGACSMPVIADMVRDFMSANLNEKIESELEGLNSNFASLNAKIGKLLGILDRRL